MIPQEQLMIGDWVSTPEGYRQIRQVFEGDGVCTKLIPTDILTDIFGPEGFDFEELEPIPLTEEILKKNFPDTDSGLGWYPEGEGFHCDTSFSNSKITALGTLHYIHELQHALRLCGIEKEIVI